MNFFQKLRDFVASPSHSRTMGIVIMLVLVSAVSLTVIASQQQQTIRQRAASICNDQYNTSLAACKADYNDCVQQQPCDPLDTRYSCNINSYNSSDCTGDTINVIGGGTCRTPDVSANNCNNLGQNAEGISLGSTKVVCFQDPSCSALSAEYTVCANKCSDDKSACIQQIAKCPTLTPTPTPAQKTTPTPTPLPAAASTQCTGQPSTAKPCFVIIDEEKYTVEFTIFEKNIKGEIGQVTATVTPLGRSAIEMGSSWTGFTANQVLLSACGNKNKIIQAVAIAAGATAKCGSAATPAAVTAPAAQTINNKLDWIALTVNYHCAAPGPGTVTPEWNINDEAKSEPAIDFQIYRRVGNSTQTNLIGHTKGYSFQDPNSIEPSTYYEYFVTNETGSKISESKGTPSTGVGICGASGVSGSGTVGNSVVGNSVSPFQCKEQTGTYAGKYKCVDITSGSLQCQLQAGPDYSPFTQFSYTDCDSAHSLQQNATRGCCKQGAAVPTAAPTPTPTPINNILLALALNTQDIPTLSPTPTTSITPTGSITPTVTIAPTFSDNLSVKVSIFSRTTNELAAGNPAAQVSFVKTPIPKKQYAANMSLKDLPKDPYYVVLEKNGLLAITAFTVSTVNQTITVPATTLVYGDITKDKRITALDWSAFRDCWRKSTKDNPSCTAADFDQSGEVNPIDFNILMRGWATWNEEEKIVNL